MKKYIMIISLLCLTALIAQSGSRNLATDGREANIQNAKVAQAYNNDTNYVADAKLLEEVDKADNLQKLKEVVRKIIAREAAKNKSEKETKTIKTESGKT